MTENITIWSTEIGTATEASRLSGYKCTFCAGYLIIIVKPGTGRRPQQSFVGLALLGCDRTRHLARASRLPEARTPGRYLLGIGRFTDLVSRGGHLL